MKKIILLSFIASLLFVACKQNKGPKVYLYQVSLKTVNLKPILMEGEKSEELSLREIDTIRAKDDKDAYEQAYGRFCSSVLFLTMFDDGEGSFRTRPDRFKLENSEGKDIATTIELPNRKELEDDIWQRHIKLETMLHDKDSVKLARIEKAIQVRF